VRRKWTQLVKLTKGCYLGKEGEIVRLSYQEAIRACEKGVALMHEWKPPARRVGPDVKKGATNGA